MLPASTGFLFNDDILNMVASFTVEIISKHRKQGTIAQLNSCMAFFLHDLLSVMDRGFVFSLINRNAELDTFLSKTAGLQLGQSPARMADRVWRETLSNV